MLMSITEKWQALLNRHNGLSCHQWFTDGQYFYTHVMWTVEKLWLIGQIAIITEDFFPLHVEPSMTVTQVRIASLFTVHLFSVQTLRKYLAPFNLKIECTERYIFSSKLQNESG